MTDVPPGDRRARRQAARAEARRAGGDRRSPANRWLLPGLIVAAVVIAGVLAIMLPGAGGPTTGGSSSVPPSASGAISGAPGWASGSAGAVEAPAIRGEPLPAFDGPQGDPAVGQPAPEVSGTDFAGRPVAIENDGRPKVILFLAHWCPHCQAAVPLIQTWVSAGGVPEGVDFVSVATGIDSARPNYPPDAWLAREGWTAPVVVDTDDSVAAIHGLTAYPFWVFVGADGTVVARAVGEMTIPDLEAAIGRLTAG
jgi:cytochrome c biogenesis protein CcmG, thiol:disulfide interchange protein DsbE